MFILFLLLKFNPLDSKNHLAGILIDLAGILIDFSIVPNFSKLLNLFIPKKKSASLESTIGKLFFWLFIMSSDLAKIVSFNLYMYLPVIFLSYSPSSTNNDSVFLKFG